MNLPKGEQDAWDSFEWLMREKMEQLDYLARKAHRDMQRSTRRTSDLVRQTICDLVTELWFNVAQVEGEKAQKQMGSHQALDTTNLFRSNFLDEQAGNYESNHKSSAS